MFKFLGIKYNSSKKNAKSEKITIKHTTYAR
jgi:hypothetical protein